MNSHTLPQSLVMLALARRSTLASPITGVKAQEAWGELGDSTSKLGDSTFVGHSYCALPRCISF